ncbi:DUF4423 domain-containing protein [Bdellovibrio sp. HCB209]|uniref:DUF4423 domain-containing protein n=1 Tax=Bdellovibrio sp. HCB209 TaxID=3394354 RepID=UPI0039B5F0FC
MTAKTSTLGPYSETAKFLHEILQSKKSKNPKYSMRAFARDLKTSPARMSSLLAGHAMPGKIVRNRILATFNLSPEQTEKLNFLIGKSLQDRKSKRLTHEIPDTAYQFLPEWHHYAILNLMETVDFQSDPKWIARRLCVTEDIVTKSIQKLLLANLAKEENGKLVPTHQNLTSTHDIPSEALKNYHRQLINQSLKSLEKDPLELRDITSLIIPTNPRQIQKAKLLARQFRLDLSKILEEGEKTEVYNVCIQITPATQSLTANEKNL